MRSKTALRRDPSKPQTGGGLTQSLQRLSPGVYRDAGGRLTNQSGRALPQQPNRQQPPMESQLQRPQNMNPMQRPQGPLTDPGFMQTSIGQPAQLPPGSNAYDYAGAMTGQQPEQPGMVNLPAQYAPGQNMGALLSGIAEQGNMDWGQAQNGMYWAPGFGPNAAQMPQPSANNNGQYRLSPGVYGTREQAMQQSQMNQWKAPQGVYNQVAPNKPQMSFQEFVRSKMGR
jgi:hypothetical protein